MTRPWLDEPTSLTVRAHCVPVSAKTSWVLLVLSGPDGAAGYGEATCFGAEAEIGALITALSAALADDPVSSLHDLLSRLAQSEMGRARRVLCSALEQAWLDLTARRAGRRIVDQLGGPVRMRVPFYANINRGIDDRSPDGFAAQASHIQTQVGAQALKIAPFDGLRWQKAAAHEQSALLQLGLDRVAAVRAAVPKGTRLLVDCHARLTPFLARQAFPALARAGVFWVEEPCDMAGLAPVEQRALRHAANDLGMRLAGAEDITSLSEMAKVISDGGHDVVLPDLRLTGITDGIAMLRLAVDMGVEASLHNPVGPVLDALSTQIAAALPSFLILERQIGESVLFDELRGAPVRIQDGEVVLPRAAGLGFVPDLRVAEPLETSDRGTPISFAGLAGAGPDA